MLMNIIIIVGISLVIMSVVMAALAIRLLAGKKTALRAGNCGAFNDKTQQQDCCCGDVACR
jgi:hypothetical protein